MVFISGSNDDSMFYGATSSIFEKARQLRNNPTKAEQVLWERINRKQLGVKFRRQHPLYQYIVDFYCHEKKLVIEVDGDYHLDEEQKEYDIIRSDDLMDFTIEVIRFTNEEILVKADETVGKIKKLLARPAPNP